jgi:hypothetical protein
MISSQMMIREVMFLIQHGYSMVSDKPLVIVGLLMFRYKDILTRGQGEWE